MISRGGYALKLGIAAAILLSLVTRASAVSFKLGGLNEVGVGQDLTSVLYASSPSGSAIPVAKLGQRAPGGGVISDLGVPVISNDGLIVFGAEVTRPHEKPQWKIMRADLEAPAGKRLAFAIDAAAQSPGCTPKFILDPYPVAGDAGKIAFIAPDVSGKDTLFRYSDGELTCQTRIGTPTVEGDSIREFRFGSAMMTASGEIAFMGHIDSGFFDPAQRRLALMVTDETGAIHEVASEGDRTPDGGYYTADFSIPAVASTPGGPIVAFSAHTTNGDSLYLWQNGNVTQLIGTGAHTPFGRLTYISSGRPGLTSDGVVAAAGVTNGKRTLFLIHGGRTSLVLREGHGTGFGTRIEYLGDPGLTTTGQVMVGVTDDEGSNVFYVADAGRRHPVSFTTAALSYGFMTPMFGGSLAVTEDGDFTFLGGRIH
ncbi:MAG TPA: hypothetical protein VMA09_20260 [Candidatus Binataceae bacterium]|nr:hypothetical protein [Candidatus Binataceae bacterium]